MAGPLLFLITLAIASAKAAHHLAGLHLANAAQHSGALPYTCWEPVTGLSSPVVTIFTVWSTAAGSATASDEYAQLLHTNRLQHSLDHGYRYCEMSERDHRRNAAWTKLPFTLALLQCSDFVLHVDGDAFFTNLGKSFSPWLEYMQRNDVDLLLSEDEPGYDAVNFGVFCVRQSRWVWHLFQELYRTCTCDNHRQNAWPAEQGMLYQLLSQHVGGEWETRTHIIPPGHWNYLAWPHWPQRIEGATGKEYIVHFVGPAGVDQACLDANGGGNFGQCKAQAVVRDAHTLQQQGKMKIPETMDESQFKSAMDTCLRIRTRTFTNSTNTGDQHGEFVTTLLGWNWAPIPGEGTQSNDSFSAHVARAHDPHRHPASVELHEVACHDTLCELPWTYDSRSGTGPIPKRPGVFPDADAARWRRRHRRRRL